jgi:mannose-6-phosphate isomerase-like protein (cupin superfamily)
MNTFNLSNQTKILKLLKNEIISVDRYTAGQLIALDRNKVNSGFKSWIANQKFSYTEWVKNINSFTVIKVEGLEDNKVLRKAFNQFKIKDIHLFNSIKTDYSFGWHHDIVNVYLYVLKGKKRVSIRNKTYSVTAGQGIIIPKGYKHRVHNYKDTWALSIGY